MTHFASLKETHHIQNAILFKTEKQRMAGKKGANCNKILPLAISLPQTQRDRRLLLCKYVSMYEARVKLTIAN